MNQITDARLKQVASIARTALRTAERTGRPATVPVWAQELLELCEEVRGQRIRERTYGGRAA